MLMTEQEIIDLTDNKYPAHQKKWLARNGIPFVLSSMGKPKVDYDVVKQVLGWNVASKESKRRREPNFK